MVELEKRLIQAVCENDLSGARKLAKTMLERNKTKKDELFCSRMLARLDSSCRNTLLELPPALQGLLVMEDVSASFQQTRYYLSPREEKIAETIFKMSRASARLAEIGINYVNSTILYGESGTGKTTFGRYIACKMGIPFAYLNFSRTIDSLMGGTQKNISKAFDYVKKQKCVFMLDEIDSIGSKRGSGSCGTGEEMSRVVISLLQELDLLTGDVVLLGATNRPDIIDPALLRRFTTQHEVKRLSERERAEMAHLFLEDVGFRMAPDIFETLVSRDDTQAGLIKRMVMALVEHYSEME